MAASTIAQAVDSAAGGASSTAEFYFQKGGVPMSVRVGPGQLGQGKSFKVKAVGRVTGGTTTNFTVRLDYGTSATIADNTTIEASTARAVDSESAPWFIEADLVCDSTSDKIQGQGRSMVNGVMDTWTITDAEITGADPDTAEIGFTVSGQFSASHASNSAVCERFSIVEL